MISWPASLPLLCFWLAFAASFSAISAEPTRDPYLAYKYRGNPPQSFEDWAFARSRYNSDPAWKDWADSERMRLQRWQARGGDRPDWVAGYMHEYFDPASLKELKWTEDTPPPPSGAPGSPEAKRFGAWVFYFRSRNASYILLAARLHALTGDRKALDWASEQIDLYARQYSRWPLQTRARGRAHLMSSSLDEAELMAALVPAIRLIQTEIPPDRLKVWKDELLAPSARNLLLSFHGFNNISVWQRSMAANIALLLKDEALWQEAVWGNQGVAAILRTATTRDGIWNEGTFGYGEYVVQALLPFLHEATVQGRRAEIEPLRRMAHDLLVAPLALRFPDATLPNPGDNRGRPSAFKLRLLREAAYLLPTPIGVVEWRSSKSWPAMLVNWNPEAAHSGPLALDSQRMDDTGFAMLRHKGWHLFLHYGQASPNHAQYEALSFELHHDKGPIVTDLGTTVYGSPLHQQYFTRAAAHNVPVVDDRGQTQFALGKLLSFEPEHGRMSARQQSYQPGATVTRSFLVDAESITDSIQISRDSKTGGSIGAILHLDCEVSLPTLPGSPRITLPADSGFGYWQQTGSFLLPSQFEFRADCGPTPLLIKIEGPSQGSLLVSTPPVLDIRNRTAIFIRYPASSGQVQTTYTLLGTSASGKQ